MTRDFEYAAILEFDDVEGLREYLTHSVHESIGQFFTTAAAAALAYDYELVNITDL
jgi:stress responsive alpha/beta barrel protein